MAPMGLESLNSSGRRHGRDAGFRASRLATQYRSGNRSGKSMKLMLASIVPTGGGSRTARGVSGSAAARRGHRVLSRLPDLLRHPGYRFSLAKSQFTMCQKPSMYVGRALR
jgi:hypothetical protein